MRRILGAALRLLAVVAWLVALALAALTVASRTDWGRARLARALEARLEKLFDGDVGIASVEGALPGQVIVRGFRLDRGGETVLAADRLELRWDLLALRRRTFHLDVLRLEGPLVRGDRLAGIVRPAPAAEPWRFRVDALEVRDGRVLAGGRTIEGVSIRGRVDWTGPDGYAVVHEARGRWREQDLAAVARGRLLARNGHRVLIDARLDTSRGWAWVPLAVDRSALASFAVEDAGRGVALLAGDEVVAAAEVTRRPARLDVRLRGDLSDQAVEAEIDGLLGGTRVRGLRVRATRRGDAIGIAARLGRDRLRALVRLEPLRGWVEASIDRPQLQLDGRARLSRRGQATRLALERLAFTARRLRGTARGGEVSIHPGGALSVTGLDVATDAGRIEVEGSLGGVGRAAREDARLHLHATDFDLGRLREALGVTALPRRGTLTVDAHATRRGRALVFDGDLTARALVWRPEDPPLDARVHLDLRPGRLDAQAVLEVREAGRAALTIASRAPSEALDARAWRALAAEDVRSARVELADLDLATLARVAGRPGALAGTVDGVIVVPERARRVEARLSARRLQGREAAADLTLEWDEEGIEALATGRLGGADVGEARVELGLPLRAPLSRAADAPLSVAARVDGFPIDRLNRAGLIATPMAGILFSRVEVGGTARRPRLRGEARLLGGRVAAARFYEAEVTGSADLGGARGRVRALQMEGGRLDAEFDVPRDPGARQRIDLRARALDLSLLAALLPGSGLGGRLDADLRVTGTRAAPAAEGAITVRGGRAVVEGVRRLDRIELDARITPGRVVLRRASARVGAGRVSLEGEAALDGLAPRRFGVDVTTERLSVPAGARVVSVDVEGRVAGRTGPGGWRIEARAARGTVRLPRERRGELQSLGALEDVVYVDARARAERARKARAQVAGAPPRATIHVTAPRGVRVRGPDVDALVTGDLEIEVGGAETTVAGGVEVLEGSATIFDRRYEILHARAWFDGRDADPQIDVRMAHEFQTTTLYVALQGTLSRPRLRLSSDPAVHDEAQLLGFVLGGNPDDPALADRRLEERAAGVASGLVASQVRNRLREVLPVDVLRVQLEEDPAGAQGARFEIGKWLTDDLLLGYRFRSTTAEEENTNEATFEWHFLRRWLLEARYGDRGVGSADVLWRKRY